MLLTKLNYFEYKNKPNYWEINDVNLGKFNLIVGLNAVGKTRLMNVISNLAKFISKKVKLKNSYWNIEISGEEDKIYAYELELKGGIINKEKLLENDVLLLDREKDKGKIFSKVKNDMEIFYPPENELALNIRRDIKSYPYLEDLIMWANNFLGYTFSCVRPNEISIPQKEEGLLENLNTTPYILLKLFDNIKRGQEGSKKVQEFIKQIINDLAYVGYPSTEIGVEPIDRNKFIIGIKEMDLNCHTNQIQMSQGMYRAISLIIIIEQILRLNKKMTVIIDDLGEGLDFTRSMRLTKLLFNKVEGSKIQTIITSNDRFLINSVDIKYISFLERHGHKVKTYNYLNSKNLFEDLIMTGLNNFDFLSDKMYKGK